MLKLYTGDKKLIKDRIQQLANNVNMEIKYSKNIYSDLNNQYGLFFKPQVLYFIYEQKDFVDKESIESFLSKIDKSKSHVVCIIETELDKRSSFYKTFSKRIESLGTKQHTKTLDEKVNDFYNDYRTIVNIETKEAVSFLYKLFYDFRIGKYKREAGYCINLVLTGQAKTEDILKIFLLETLDKNKNI